MDRASALPVSLRRSVSRVVTHVRQARFSASTKGRRDMDVTGTGFVWRVPARPGVDVRAPSPLFPTEPIPDESLVDQRPDDMDLQSELRSTRNSFEKCSVGNSAAPRRQPTPERGAPTCAGHQRPPTRPAIMVGMTDQTQRPTPPTPPPGFIDLHARLAAGETLYGTFLSLASPVATEIAARAGFDWALIDLEHGAGTEADLLANLHAMG